MTALVPVLLVLSCLGFGAGLLRLLGLRDALPPFAHAAMSFALGLGVLGWSVFPLGVAGLLGDGWLWGLVLAGVPGMAWLRWGHTPTSRENLDALGWTLLALLASVAVLDLAEGLTPPGDADSLAYHFNAPRLFLEWERIGFILRPLDGSIPYLVQMTYLTALALGGEKAMTLWCALSGWGAGALVYALAREHLDRNGSLMAALVFLTVPAVTYGGGSGQIEVRTALFAMAAAWAAARAVVTGRLSFTVLAGLATGFFIGAKYMGLLFALACGLVLLWQRRWFLHGLVFSLVAVATGAEWYAWNAIHTGDPFFPMFFQWFGRDDLALWTPAQDEYFRTRFMPLDRPIPRTPWNFLLYPFWVTLASPPAIEGAQAGLGPFGLLVLPFALAEVWRKRRSLRGTLAIYAAIAFLFYAAWFFSGPSQRVRHLLPILPFLLIGFLVAAHRWTEGRSLRRPLIVALAATLALQMVGAALFGLKSLRHLASGEDRETYLRRTISRYAPVPWINDHLDRNDLLLTGDRQLFYFLRIPYLFSSPNTQAAVHMGGDDEDPGRLHRELRSAGITHILMTRRGDARMPYDSPALNRLAASPCLDRLNSFESRRIASRTLGGENESETMDLLTVRHGLDCQAALSGMVPPS